MAESGTSPAEEQGADAKKSPDASSSSQTMGLSRKLASISSLPESSKEKAPWSEHVRVYSTLPEALSKMNRKMRVDELPEQLAKVEVALEEEEYNEVMHVEDPDPGVLLSGMWFLFSFGKFVRGPMLRQSKGEVLGLMLFLCVAMCSQGMEWSHASLVSVLPVMWVREFYLRLSWVMGAVFAASLIMGLLISWALGTWERGLPGFTGLRIVVNALLPLGIIQLFLMILQLSMYGEAYWRGVRLLEIQHITESVLLFLWGISGLRIAVAIFASRKVAIHTQIFLKFLAFVVGLAPGVDLHAGVVEQAKQAAVEDWNLASRQALAPGSFLDEARFEKIETHLPLREVQIRQDLYLLRLQQQFRQRNLEAALDNAILLERISPGETAMDELGKGLQEFLEGRLDLAVPHWKDAVLIEPDCVAAHQWLALAEMANDLVDAERHARILMQIDPNVFHFYLLVRVLDAQGKQEEIWQAQFEVNAPVDEWYPLSVSQVGLAARALGNEKRALALLGPEEPVEPEVPAETSSEPLPEESVDDPAETGPDTVPDPGEESPSEEAPEVEESSEESPEE